ncbi:hypothetical protein ACIQNG_25600 [Streptomyces sp. NPDC091377]|uniref:hypothetical protein n=1 Tax=Streptomyces sp. NPDC091377 TaxID=3365995 RepID=UPI00382DE221
MPRGGARTVSGPPPDPAALRRNRPSDKAGWTLLPYEGRPGLPPGWPLTEATDREWDLWCGLWERPQAVMWEELGQEFEVALFVRCLAEAEQPGAKVDVRKLARQYLDSLGLSVQGMLRNRWKVSPGEPGTAAAGPADESGPPAPRRPSARDRMKVVPLRAPGA